MPTRQLWDDRMSLAAPMPHFAYDSFLGIGKIEGLITSTG